MAPMPGSGASTMSAPADFADGDDVSSIMSTESLEDNDEEAPAAGVQRQTLPSPQRTPMLNAKPSEHFKQQRAAAPAAGPKPNPVVAQAKKAIADAAARAKAAAVAKVHA